MRGDDDESPLPKSLIQRRIGGGMCRRSTSPPQIRRGSLRLKDPRRRARESAIRPRLSKVRREIAGDAFDRIGSDKPPKADRPVSKLHEIKTSPLDREPCEIHVVDNPV